MKLKTIIVDDSTMQRMAISKLVSKHPQLNLIAEYSNAIEARNALKNYEIDLIFLDIEMPIKNGFQTSQEIRNHKDPNIKNIPKSQKRAKMSEDVQKYPKTSKTSEMYNNKRKLLSDRQIFYYH